MRYLQVIICIVAGLISQATILSPSEALTKAIGAQSRTSVYEFRHTYNDNLGNAAIYEFIAPEKTIFVSAHNDTQSLLGWTDYPMSDSTAMPPAMLQWIEQLSQALPSAQSESSIRNAITPLLATNWNQTNPYNIYCPTISGVHAPTGCVATAMAMVVHHNRVFKGSGQANLFDIDGNNWAIDLDDITFDFESMPLNSGQDGNWHEVALLSAICGVTSKMIYGLSGSGAYLVDAANALKTQLGYDPTSTVYLTRKSYTIEEWNSILYNELSSNRPIIYAGGINEPHCFVCDGYQPGNYFHFNWGWGGMGNGYFALTSLIPTSAGTGSSSSNNYTGAQECVLCRVPGAVNASLPLKITGYCARSTADRFKVMFSMVGPSGDYTIDGGYIIESDYGQQVGCRGIGEVTCRSNSVSSVGVTIDIAEAADGLAPGYYLIYPAYKLADQEEFVKATEPKGDYAIGLEITDEGRSNLVEITTAPHLWVEEIKLHGAVYKTTSPTISFRVTNSGRKDAYESMSVAILDPKTKELLRSRLIDNIELSPGASALFRTTISNYKVGSGYLPEGEYIVAVCSANCDSIYATMPSMLSISSNADPSVVSASSNPSITIERLTVEPELLLPPYQWSHKVSLTVGNTQSATIGIGFFEPGTYTPTYKFTLPYQRWEQCSRSQKEISIADVDPAPGRYEVAYMAGGLEISSRLTIDVALCLNRIYYLLNHQNHTAAVVAIDSKTNGHIKIPQSIRYLGVDYAVTSICSEAFVNCPTLLSVDCPTTVSNVEGAIFTGSEPSAIIIRSPQPPFALWKSVFSNLTSVPTIYVDASSFASYQTMLDGNELYALIEDIEPQCPQVIESQPNSEVELTIKITPASANYHQAFLAITDNPSIATITPKGYTDHTTSYLIHTHGEGSTRITISHPQPGFAASTIDLNVLPEITGLEEIPMHQLSVVRTDANTIEIRHAMPGQRVRVTDLLGRVIVSGIIPDEGSLTLHLQPNTQLIILSVGSSTLKLY